MNYRNGLKKRLTLDKIVPNGRASWRLESRAQRSNRRGRNSTKNLDQLKVSQASKLPVSRPIPNQRTRSSELPWVKASGTT